MKNTTKHNHIGTMNSRLMFLFESLSPETRKQKLLQYLQFVATDLEIELWKKWAKSKWLTWSFQDYEKKYNEIKEKLVIETDSKKINQLNRALSKVLNCLKRSLSLYDKQVEWLRWGYETNEFDNIGWINIDYYWPKKCYYISSYNRAIKLKVDYIKWEGSFKISLWNSKKPIYFINLSSNNKTLVIKQIKSLIMLAHKINEICYYYWNPIQAHDTCEVCEFQVGDYWKASIKYWEKYTLFPYTKVSDTDQLSVILNEWRYFGIKDSIKIVTLKVKNLLIWKKDESHQIETLNQIIKWIFEHLDKNWKKEYPEDYWHKLSC